MWVRFDINIKVPPKVALTHHHPFGNCPWKLCIFVAESEDAAKYTPGWLTCGMYKDSNPRDMRNMKEPSFAICGDVFTVLILLIVILSQLFVCDKLLMKSCIGKNWHIT